MNSSSAAPSFFQLYRAAVPLLVGFASLALLRSVDLLGAARGGETSLAGVGLAGSLLGLIISVSARTLSLSAIRIAKAYERRDFAEFARRLRSVALAAFLAPALVILLPAVVISTIGSRLGLDESICRDATNYLLAQVVGAGSITVSLIFGALILPLFGKQKAFVQINVACLAGHFALSQVFVRYLFTSNASVAFAIGLSGCICAVGSAVATGSIAWRFSPTGQSQSPHLSASRLLVDALESIREGMSIGVARGAELGLFTAVGAYAATVGVHTAAEFSVLMNVASIVGMWTGAVSQSGMQSLARLRAAKLRDVELRRVTHDLILLGVVPAILIGAFWAVLVSIGTPTGVPPFAWTGLSFSLFLIADAAISIYFVALRVVNDVSTPFRILVLAYWVVGYGGISLVGHFVPSNTALIFTVLSTSLGIAAAWFARRFNRLVALAPQGI